METVDPIITDEKALSRISLPVTWEQIKEQKIVERIKTSLTTSWTKGVGLAAVQIGIYLRVVWFTDAEDKEEWTLVNPVITKATNPIVVPKEGCLSIPNTWSQTRRYLDVSVRTIKEDGDLETLTFSGFRAIVVQHEIDHINGILNLSRRYTMPPTVGRNEACPECMKKGTKIKWKKCQNHNIAQFPI